jgi:bacillithiol biosynthesis deacetylase BshB1
MFLYTLKGKKMKQDNKIDVIAFSPHPDDAEMGCGGLLLKLKDKGYKTGIIDLTRGELSTNGDLETRKVETEEASSILKLDIRENLGLEDANIINNKDNRLKVIGAVRKYRPDLALIPYHSDRHPDHENSYKLLKDALFISGLEKFQTGAGYHRPQIILNYMLHDEFKPSFVVDISEYYDVKLEAVGAYKSQFYNNDTRKIMTYIASKHFYEIINSRHQCMGLKINTQHGEPYHMEQSIKIDDPIKFFSYMKIQS